MGQGLSLTKSRWQGNQWPSIEFGGGEAGDIDLRTAEGAQGQAPAEREAMRIEALRRLVPPRRQP